MQATITYLLTEQAQRAQMAATGQPVARKQTILEDVPNDLATSPLVSINEDGSASISLSSLPSITDDGEINRYGNVGFLFSRVPESGLAAVQEALADIDRRRADKLAQIEKRKRDAELMRVKEERAIDMFLADPDARGSASGKGRIMFVDADLTHLSRTGTGYTIDLDHTERWREARTEIERRHDADVAAKEAAEAAKEQAKQDYIAAWIAEHGDRDTRDQFAEGLLSRNAALTMIAEHCFSSHGISEAVKVSEPCDDRECPCCDDTVETLPRRVYPAWREFKAKLPEGSKATFSKVRQCLRDEDWDGDGETAAPAYYTADLTVPCGPFQFERRVKLG